MLKKIGFEFRWNLLARLLIFISLKVISVTPAGKGQDTQREDAMISSTSNTVIESVYIYVCVCVLYIKFATRRNTK